MRSALIASIASRKALAIASSLRRYGFTVYGLSHTVHPHVFSRLFDRKAVLECGRSELAWAKATAEMARVWGAELVIPVDFADVATFSRWRGLFDEVGCELVAPPFESVALAADKERLPRILRGIAKAPKQIAVRERCTVDELVSLEPPLVVKGLGDASKPEYFPDREAAAKRASERAPCLIQEYVPGVGRGYYAVAIDGEPILEFTHQRILEYDPAGGASLAARGPVMDPRLFKLGREIVKLLKWSGPIMVETRFTPETGEYHIVELNPKFWGSLDLPVSLGYHFPAVLALAYVEGLDAARKLAASLSVRGGGFYWVLDGLRYVAKVPSSWILLLVGAAREGRSDFDGLDPARVAAQIAWGLSRLPRERKQWVVSLSRDLRNLGWWFNKLLHQGVKVVLFDLDGTLASLPVDWNAIKLKLQQRGLMKPWEGVVEALRRLWVSDQASYEEASLLVEEVELEAARSAKPLVDTQAVDRLTLTAQVVTLQSSRSARETLKRIGLAALSGRIVGRDGSAGPYKESVFRSVEKPSLVVEDNLNNAVHAMRAGHLPVLVSMSAYTRVKALRLGIPSIPHPQLPHLLSMVEDLARPREGLTAALASN